MAGTVAEAGAAEKAAEILSIEAPRDRCYLGVY